MADADTPSSDQQQHWSDKWLRNGEAVVVLFITLATVLLIVYGLGWATFCGQKAREVKLLDLSRELNNNWKILFILLVPLFYRSIRMFLERVEEAWGMKAPHKPRAAMPEQPNPQKRPEQKDNPEQD
jgi:hypothetical protein